MNYLAQEKEQWMTIRRQLLGIRNNRYNHTPLWTAAAGLFENSMSKKYMIPLRTVRRRGEHKGEGYLIVSSLIIVIEVLASFRDGKAYKNPVINRYTEYNDSKTLLIRFLKTNESFGNVFDSIADSAEPENQDIYEDFYYNVRCNLIHGGRLNSNWTISSEQADEINQDFIRYENNKKVIYRNVLLKVINDYITEYIKLLNNPLNDYNDLRKKFARRFDWHFDQDYNVW